MHILSYDIASKSLALSILKFNDGWIDDLHNIEKEFYNNDNNDNISDKCINVLNYLNNI